MHDHDSQPAWSAGHSSWPGAVHPGDLTQAATLAAVDEAFDGGYYEAGVGSLAHTTLPVDAEPDAAVS